MILFKKLVGISLLMYSLPSYSFCESYIGLGIGPENANFKQKALLIERPPSDDRRVIDKNQFAGRGGFASIFAGTGFRFAPCDSNCQNTYLGAEINANLRSLEHKSTNDEFISVNLGHTYYKMRRDYGISILPGILFSDCTLFYLRLGYANGRFVVDTNDSSLQNISKNLPGFRYGLGIRQGFNACWALRIEYSQTDYKETNMYTLDTGTNVSKTTRITPHTQRFEIGILYTF